MSAIDEPVAPGRFELTIDLDGARGVVRPHGEVDVATVPAVEERVQALWADGAEAVVLDLGAVTFFDSSGLCLLIRLQALAVEHERRSLALADCSDAVRRVLDLTRLTDRFQRAAA